MATKPEPDPELKAQLAILVGRLTSELGVGGGRSAEGLATASVAMLSKMISPYDVTKVSVTQAQKALRLNAPDPEAFTDLYNRLKSLGVREVDKYLAVVAKIAGDEDLRSAVTVLPRHGEQTIGSSPSNENSPFQMSYDQTVSTVGGADVASLHPMDGFVSVSTPFASDTKSKQSTTPGAKGMRQLLGDDFGEDDVFGDYLQKRVRALEIGGVDRYENENGARRHKSLVEGVDFPKLPDWLMNRGNGGGGSRGVGVSSVLARTGNSGGTSGTTGTTTGHSSGKPLREYSAASQELLILDDLLYACLGVDGRFVRAVVSYPESNQATVGNRTAADLPPDRRLPDITFEIDPGLEGSLRQLAHETLPLLAHVATVQSFVETKKNSFASGLVQHALCAEMEELLHDWRVMTTQMEHLQNVGKLSLHSFWFYARPARGALSVLAAVCKKTNSLRGAELLNALHQIASDRSGDPSAKTLTHRLLLAASSPYLKSIERWVFHGAVEDPYDEFLVLRDDSLVKESLSDEYNARYWRGRYSTRDVIPKFLSPETAQKILTTGKYIDAARESFREPASTSSGGDKDAKESFAYPPRPADGLGAPVGLRDGDSYANSFTSRIDDALAFASKQLLRTVLSTRNGGDLRARLRSCKRYFLLHQGDFLTHFVDIAHGELQRPVGEIARERLQSMLELALKTSTASDDPHADLLRCGLERVAIIPQLLAIQSVSVSVSGNRGFADHQEPEPEKPGNTEEEEKELTGMDTFTLDLHAPWPTSLVLSRTSLTKYQLLFRHVFHLKHVERRLCAAWRARQSSRRGVGGGALGNAHVALQRMLHFIQNFVHYLTMEVIEPNWVLLEKRMETSVSVDELIHAHDAFLDTVMKQGLLFWPQILKRLGSITKTSIEFANAMASLDGSWGDTDDSKHDDTDDSKRAVRHASSANDPSGFLQSLAEKENEFDAKMRELFTVLSQLAHTEPTLASLCARLDFNEYYTYGPGGKYN